MALKSIDMTKRTIDPQRGASTVIFDCDSTLAEIEGIDELAGEFADQIRALTDAAMDGSVPLDEVYGRRLEIIQPTRQRLDEIGHSYVARVIPDAREVVSGLLHLGKDVRVISGGLQPPVEFLALELGIDAEKVAAVGIDFDADGAYRGFDRSCPLARNGGKPELVRGWDFDRPAIMVGDGMTDLEVSPDVDLFVAFMGVAWRDKVAEGADVVLRQPSLAPILALAAGSNGGEALAGTKWKATYDRGVELLASAEALR